MSGPDCVFCSGARPAADHRIAELRATTAYLHDDQFFTGWTVLVLKRHASELFELAPAERALMMDDICRVAAGLHALYRPRKINYECLGNQVPHVHWHIVPRLAADPAPLDAVWTVTHTPRRLDDVARAERIASMRARFDA